MTPAAMRASNVVLLIPPPVNKKISVAERVGVVLRDGAPVVGVVVRSDAKSKDEVLTPVVRSVVVGRVVPRSVVMGRVVVVLKTNEAVLGI